MRTDGIAPMLLKVHNVLVDMPKAWAVSLAVSSIRSDCVAVVVIIICLPLGSLATMCSSHTKGLAFDDFSPNDACLASCVKDLIGFAPERNFLIVR